MDTNTLFESPLYNWEHQFLLQNINNIIGLCSERPAERIQSIESLKHNMMGNGISQVVMDLFLMRTIIDADNSVREYVWKILCEKSSETWPTTPEIREKIKQVVELKEKTIPNDILLKIKKMNRF